MHSNSNLRHGEICQIRIGIWIASDTVTQDYNDQQISALAEYIIYFRVTAFVYDNNILTKTSATRLAIKIKMSTNYDRLAGAKIGPKRLTNKKDAWRHIVRLAEDGVIWSIPRILTVRKMVGGKLYICTRSHVIKVTNARQCDFVRRIKIPVSVSNESESSDVTTSRFWKGESRAISKNCIPTKTDTVAQQAVFVIQFACIIVRILSKRSESRNGLKINGIAFTQVWVISRINRKGGIRGTLFHRRKETNRHI